MTKLSSRSQMPVVFELVEMAVSRGEWEAARRWLEVFMRARPRCGPEWRNERLAKSADDLMAALEGASKAGIKKKLTLCHRNLPAVRETRHSYYVAQ